MGRPHHQPLGLPGVHWEITECEILKGDPDGDRIGTLKRERANTWRYSCSDKRGTVDGEVLGLVECALGERLGRRVVARPVEWECRARWGFKATVALRRDDTAFAYCSAWLHEFKVVYEAFKAVEAEALRVIPMPTAMVPAAELERALDILQDILWQACGEGERLDTHALSAFAAGARLLAYYGRLQIEDEYRRRVIAQAPQEKGEKHERETATEAE